MLFKSLNNTITAYLVVNDIHSSGDFSTIIPEGQEEQIEKWNTEKLGPKPTQEQLDSSWSTYTTNLAWEEVRIKRNGLIISSDWTQVNDSPLQNKAAWATYRQALRDIPQTQTDPDNIVWPTPPN
jgi:hypothetical protein